MNHDDLKDFNLGEERERESRRHLRETELSARQREAEAMRLWSEEALTYEQIAERLGYANKGGAHKAVKRALQRIPAAAVRNSAPSRTGA